MNVLSIFTSLHSSALVRLAARICDPETIDLDYTNRQNLDVCVNQQDEISHGTNIFRITCAGNRLTHD